MTLVPGRRDPGGARRRATAAGRSSSTWRSRTSAAPACGWRCSCSPRNGALGDPAGLAAAGAGTVRRSWPSPGSSASAPRPGWCRCTRGCRARIPLAPPPHLGPDVGRDGEGRASTGWCASCSSGSAGPRSGSASRCSGLGAASALVGVALRALPARPQAPARLLTRSRTSGIIALGARRLADLRRADEARWAAVALAAALLHGAQPRGLQGAAVPRGAGSFERAGGGLRPRPPGRPAAAHAVDRRRPSWSGALAIAGAAAARTASPPSG